MITQTKRNAATRTIRASAGSWPGTAERPRLNVYRSLNHIYAQVIDDQTRHDHCVGFDHGKRKSRPAATWPRPRRSARPSPERAKAKGIKKVVFDRGGYLYHGRIKALADAAREAGLEF